MEIYIFKTQELFYNPIFIDQRNKTDKTLFLAQACWRSKQY